MKKHIILSITLLFVLAGSINGQSSKEQYIKSILDQSFDKDYIHKQVIKLLKDQMHMPEHLFKKLVDLVLREIDIDQFNNLLIQYYSENFSEEELKELASFYQSETGRKYIEVQPELNRRILEFITNYTSRQLPGIIKKGREPFQLCEEIDSLFNIADVYYQQKDYDASLNQIDLLESKYLPDAESAYTSIRKKSLIYKLNSMKYKINMVQENYTHAADNMNTIIDAYPDCEKCYKNIADAYMKSKDYEGVIAALTEALSLNGKNSDYYMERANAKDLIGDFSGANADYDSVLVLSSKWDYSEYLGNAVNIGWKKYLAGRYEECIEYSDKAIEYAGDALEKEPNLVIAGYNKALSHLCLGNTDKALALYKQYKLISASTYYADELDSGAITDLKNLIAKGSHAEMAKKILMEVFKLSQAEIDK